MAKTLTKQELKAPDEFIHWGTRAAEFAQKNLAIVVVAALVPLVVVGAVFAMSYQRQQREIEAASKLFAGEQKMNPQEGAMRGFRIPGLTGDTKPEDLKAAIATFDQVAKDYEGTKAERRAHLLAGDASMELKDYDGAAKEFDAVDGGTDLERYHALSGRAHALEAKGAFDDAASAYKKIVDDTALLNRDLATLDLARVYALAGKKDQARELLAKFGTDFPNSPMKPNADAALAALGPAAAPTAEAAASAAASSAASGTPEAH